MGFADEAWPDQFPPEIDCDVLEYHDYNESLQKYSKILKEQGCDLIMALNHMRMPDDENMASKNKAPSIVDMIFGGHDHSYYTHLNKDTDVMIVKSGCDFEEFSNVTVLFEVDKK